MASFVLLSYLDPGSGSMLLQLLVGGIAGVGVVCRFYGRSFLNRLTGTEPMVAEHSYENSDATTFEPSSLPN